MTDLWNLKYKSPLCNTKVKSQKQQTEPQQYNELTYFAIYSIIYRKGAEKVDL